jgi:Bacteriocin-protection, YdeI or OmpD-Associated/Domain of unknown function (DUF1905)
MNDWVTFEGAVETLEMGRSTYTNIRVPPAAAAVLEAAGARRVEGEIDDQPVNLALSRAPAVDGVFLWTGKSLLDRAAIRPGDVLSVRLRPAAPDEVALPEDVALALSRADRMQAWDALTPGKRRGLLYRIDTAKTQATRAKRIDALVAGLDP